MDKILIVQDERDRQMVVEHFTKIEFDCIALNRTDSLRTMEGRRVTDVYFTHAVMIRGMDRSLFEVLYHNLIFISVAPSLHFHLLG